MKENNILLAEFLGWEQLDNNKSMSKATQPYYITTEEGNTFTIDFYRDNEIKSAESFKFEEDWNWLMLVVEGIDKGSGEHIQLSCNMVEVHRQCVEFVKWYNDNK